jgi:hypothetical protein
VIRRALHHYADLAATSLLRGVRLYAGGFGDREALERLVNEVRDVHRDAPLPSIHVRWGPVTQRGRVIERRMTFASPARDVPEESRDVHGLLLEPHASSAEHATIVLLAATGEEGFLLRRRFAEPLLAAGHRVVLVENPFYGTRRPAGQLGPALRTVRDQFAMNLATVVEGRALAAWLRAQGHAHLVLSGYSQGGIMAAFVSALLPFPTGCVPRGAGARVEAIFTSGALSRAMHWDRLAREEGSREAAAAYFRACLAPVRVDRHPPPLDTRACIVVGARHDGFVPPEEVSALHDHWPGAELRWDDAGHLTAAFLSHGSHQRAILDATSRLVGISRA